MSRRSIMLILPLFYLLHHFSGFQVCGLTVSTRPQLLFTESRNVVEGSVIWLYCEVNSISNSLSVTWNKDGGRLVQDVPHIRLRTSNSSSSTTLLLVIDNVESSDAGLYQCTAQDDADSVTGDTFSMAVLSSIGSGNLNITDRDSLTTGPSFNRTSPMIGTMISLFFTAGHIGDDATMYNHPTAQWFKDGIPVSTIPNNMAIGNNGRLRSTLSVTFQESDAGVYQCLFIENDSQIYGSFPLRLDGGLRDRPVRISPVIIFLMPTDKLVVEFSAQGDYENLLWRRNTVTLGTVSAIEDFVNFQEIYFRGETSATDYGTYTVGYSGDGGFPNSPVYVAPQENPRISVMNPVVNVFEDSDINITCTGIGGPLPTITWTLNDAQTPFNQSQTTVPPSFSSTREAVISGNVRSTLRIVNAQYPTHNGIYTCSGNNSLSGTTNSSDIRVIVKVKPDIVLEARNRPRVAAGEAVILLCTVVRGNPANYSFQWYHNSQQTNFTLISQVSSSIELPGAMQSDTGMYECNVTNEAGTALKKIELTIGVPPEVVISDDDDRVVLANLAMVLSCSSIRGDTPISFSWMGPNSNTNLMANNANFSSNVTLTPPITDYGIYTCTASNSYGTSQDTVQIIQAVPPTNVTSQTDMVQTLSPQSAILSCTAEGLPLPTFIWIKVSNNEPEVIFNTITTQRNSKTYSIATSMGISNFTITPTSATDSASYTCVAVNRLGNSTGSVSLTVYEAPEISDPTKHQQFTVNEQLDIVITCRATGFPAPEISFYYNGQEPGSQQVQSIDRVTLGSVFNVLNTTSNLYEVSRSLSIANAMDSDSGSLICSAMSDIPMYGMKIENVSFSLLVQIAANITNPPSPQVVTSINPASFTCSASGLPLPNIMWINPDGTILESDQNNVEIISYAKERSVASTLTISSTSPSVSGSYMCSVSNGVLIPEVVTRVTVDLTVYVIPEITSYLPEGSTRYVVNVTDDIAFQCTATGVPPPDIQWYRGNIMLNSSSGRVKFRTISIEEPNRALANVTRQSTLIATSTSDAGNYRCVATNAATGGENSVDFELNVQVPPRITRQSNRVLATMGTSVSLTFDIVDAVPGVTENNIQWYYTTSAPAGIPNFNSTDFQEITHLMNRTSTSMLEFSSNKRTLTIRNIFQSIGATSETDQGRYFIRASNPTGDVNNFIDVIVRGPAQIVGGPEDREVLGGSGFSVTFSCQAIASPEHNISWSYEDANGNKFNDIITTSSGNMSKYQILSDFNGTNFGQLTVLNIEYSDRGTYSCIAANIVGEVMDSGTLKVQVAPTLIEGGITSPRDTELRDSVAIFCHATGSPTPGITWRKNGASFDGGNITMFTFLPRLVATGNDTMDFMSTGFDGSITEIIMSNNINLETYNTMNNQSIVGVLLFDHVSPGSNGDYTCIASNNLPMTSVVSITSNPVQLIVLVPPPSDFMLVSIMKTSLTVMWNSLYDINYFQVAADFNATYSVRAIYNSSTAQSYPNGTWSATLTGLNPGSRYNIYVTSLGNDLLEATTSSAGPISVLTASSELFQLVFKIGTSCNTWINDNPHLKSQDITAHITSVLIEQCQCNVDSTNAISSGGFQCFTDSPQLVTYRSQIQGASNVAARDLIQILQLWLLTGPSINVRAQILNVKTSCPVLITTLNEPGCASPTISPTTDVVITSSEVNLMTVIIIVVVVFGTIISLVAVLAVIIILRLKSKGSAKTISSQNISSEINLQNFQRDPSEFLPAQSNDIHEYDTIENDAISQQSTIENQGVSQEEFAFTQCEAYDTHKLPGRRNGPANASNTHEKAYEVVDITGNQVERREMKQSYENIRQNMGGRNIEVAYESIQDNN